MTDSDNQTAGKLLVVDDDSDVLQAARLLLKQHAYQIDTLNDPAGIPQALGQCSYDAILLDMNFTRDVTSGLEGLDWLTRILQIDPDAIVILITAFGDTDTAVQAIKAGATDFVIKPWQNEKLLATVNAGVRLCQSRRTIDRLESQEKQLHADLDRPFHDFVGKSPSMLQVYRMIEKVADTDANVLIFGENGTGKELVARAIHRESARRDEIFCKVDLSTIAATLFESELFGHTKGAFTDARESRAGRFEVASGGTLFLDEISNLPFSLQPKLLTAIENRQVTRVGSNQPVDVDIRLICASNLQLQSLVEKRQFREDLFYRINTVTINIPPLRERAEDIPLLAGHYLEIYRRKYSKPSLSLGAGAIARLTQYHWPGNVRELQHAIERAVILSEHSTLDGSDFPTPSPTTEKISIPVDSYDLNLMEKTVIRRALAWCDGNITKAAQALGLTRTSLYRRMQKHGL